MTSVGRAPTWKEKENNKRRERRRRAIAAKIYAGLRAYGNYRLPKHCDNNEVLKALCDEAGWTVEADGTTYRKGCKPMEPMEVAGASVSASPCSSYNPSPASSSYITHASIPINGVVSDANSLIPWLKNLSSASSSASSSKNIPNHRHHSFYMHNGSISAPVSPPLSSPSSPRIKTEWDGPNAQPAWPPGAHYTFLPSSTPSSPGRRRKIPKPAWLAGLQIQSGTLSPTFSLVASNPFGFYNSGDIASAGSSRMWTPGQSGICSPVMPLERGDVQIMDCASDEFAFGSNGNDNLRAGGLVKPWEGERIHEECGPDELELTLGSSRTKADA